MELVELKGELTILCPNSKHTIENKLVLKGGGKLNSLLSFIGEVWILNRSFRDG